MKFMSILAIAILAIVIILAVATGSNEKKAKNQDQEVNYNNKIGLSIKLARGSESSAGSAGISSGGNYKYEMEIRVCNLNQAPFRFDSVEIYFTDGLDNEFNNSCCESGQTIFLTKDGIGIAHQYGDDKKEEQVDSIGKKNLDPDGFIIPGYRTMKLRSSTTTKLTPTTCGRSITIINAMLCLNGKPVSGLYRAALPPLMKIPDDYRLAKDDGGYKIDLLPASELPASSGIFNPEILDRVFKKATATSPDAELVEVEPEIMTTLSYVHRTARLLPAGWNYKFHSGGKRFSISRVDPSVVSSELSEFPWPIFTIDKKMMATCIVDCDTAVMMLESTNAECTGKDKTKFSLILAISDFKKRLAWDIGYKIDGKDVFIFADTGQFVYRDHDDFKPFAGIIWNE